MSGSRANGALIATFKLRSPPNNSHVVCQHQIGFGLIASAMRKKFPPSFLEGVIQ